MRQKLRVGTRGSFLARRQTAWVTAKIKEQHPHLDIEQVLISTRGDLTTEPLPRVGEKGLFTRELERALVNEEIDFAVHSLKDLPVELLPGLTIGAVPRRANPLDALVTREISDLTRLPWGARVGTSSLRRAAQLRYLRPDIIVMDLRGNLDTRLRKLERGFVDALILAAAGLERIGWEAQNIISITPEICLPAPGQGALAVEIREDDQYMKEICLNSLEDTSTRQAVTAERAFLNALGGGCQIPVGALALVQEDCLWLRGIVLQQDGKRMLRGEIRGIPEEPFSVGNALAQSLLEKGAHEILAGGL
ncbi:MAG: hydroxymethylbilane synthase [Bacillota bacterium]|nr:hydroxymethylbilane synthase [Bacillota bacterium]